MLEAAALGAALEAAAFGAAFGAAADDEDAAALGVVLGADFAAALEAAF